MPLSSWPIGHHPICLHLSYYFITFFCSITCHFFSWFIVLFLLLSLSSLLYLWFPSACTLAELRFVPCFSLCSLLLLTLFCFARLTWSTNPVATSNSMILIWHNYLGFCTSNFVGVLLNFLGSYSGVIALSLMISFFESLQSIDTYAVTHMPFT